MCTFGSHYPGDGSQPSLGRAFSYVTVEIWDDQGQVVPPGTPGQIVLAGPLARGYTDPAQTAERFLWRNGVRWCLTGDYGVQQPDGTYRFLGRRDAQHKVSGYLLNLGAIEAAVRGHPEVADCKAFLVGGRYPIVYVTLRHPGMLRMSELRTFLRPRLPTVAFPVCCITLEALPLTPSGKVSQRQEDYPEPQREQYLSFEEEVQPPVTDAERQVAEIVQRCFPASAPPRGLFTRSIC